MTGRIYKTIDLIGTSGQDVTRIESYLEAVSLGHATYQIQQRVRQQLPLIVLLAFRRSTPARCPRWQLHLSDLLVRILWGSAYNGVVTASLEESPTEARQRCSK